MIRFAKLIKNILFRNIKRGKVCRFIWADKTGNLNPLNDTYDGSIGYLVEKKADVFLRALDFGTSTV